MGWDEDLLKGTKSAEKRFEMNLLLTSSQVDDGFFKVAKVWNDLKRRRERHEHFESENEKYMRGMEGNVIGERFLESEEWFEEKFARVKESFGKLQKIKSELNKRAKEFEL